MHYWFCYYFASREEVNLQAFDHAGYGELLVVSGLFLLWSQVMNFSIQLILKEICALILEL